MMFTLILKNIFRNQQRINCKFPISLWQSIGQVFFVIYYIIEETLMSS